ncbi:MAG: hypothetical protein ACOX56_01435 [Acholeplasmataceae bacterium]|jgi:hypothetical protein
MKKTNISKVLILSFVLILTAVVLGFSIAKEKVVVHGYTRSTSIIPEHDFEDIVEYSGNSFYISYTDFRLNIANATATPASIKAALQFSMPEAQRIKIRFDTAQELYNFSVDVSPFASQYQHAGTLLELHYVLGKDIDYNDLGGTARFIPIGYNYQDTLGDLIHDEFSGIFDGRGFEISNLYLADNKENELYIVENDQEIITTPYYSMFSFNSGTIKNFGLVNPLFELRIGDSDLTKAAHIVGENTGIVEKVYVNYSGTNKGIYFVTDLGHQTRPQAAGLVFWNKGNGQLLNSYYASEVVILPQHMRNFRVESPAGSGIYKAAIQPGVFRADTTSTVSGLVYDSTRYLLSVVSGGQTVNVETPSAFHTAKTTTELKTNGMDAGWFYYPNYRYPALFGLNQDSSDRYVIESSVDFIYFNKILNLPYVEYKSASYIISDSVTVLDLRDLAPRVYKTPLAPFSGTFDGNNKKIAHLVIDNGKSANRDLYVGMFGTLCGTVKNLTIVQSYIDLKDYQTVNFNYHIGLIAGTIDNGIVQNVQVKGNVILNKQIPQNLNVGIIAGEASGQILDVFVDGDLSANTIYNQNELTDVKYNIGGIVGSTINATLKMNNVLHLGDITSPLSNLGTSYNNKLTVNLGGVLGLSNNVSGTTNQYKLITHVGKIGIMDLNGTKLNYLVGGVIGDTSGGSFSNSGELNRNWTHRGAFYNYMTNIIQVDPDTYTNPYKMVKVAGVLNSNLSAYSDFIDLHNYDIQISGVRTALVDSVKNEDIVYVPIINSRSVRGIGLYQASNDAMLEFDYHFNYHGIVKTLGNSKLRFIENKGSLTFKNFSYSRNVVVAAISTSTKISYQNVFQESDITITNLTNAITSQTDSPCIKVAGFAPLLLDESVVDPVTGLTSYVYIKDSYNKGKIIVGDINNNYGNIYVAGLVNENASGDLQTQDDSLTPHTTYGIIDSINYGDITSTYQTGASPKYGIHGLGNVFVGGLVTNNRFSIQDSINHGNVTFYNDNTNATAQFTSDSSGYYAGRIESYHGGVIVGGVAAFVGAEDSRIYDTSNSGEIIGVNKAFARAGGIVAVVLAQELIAGNIQGFASTITSTTDLSSSRILNGINYSRVIALTSIISQYDDSTPVNPQSRLYFYPNGSTYYSTFTHPTTTKASGERPGINASAGGVIGYGLSEMRRMINHGEVISTDVAGGVVGATFVFKKVPDSSERYPKIYVKIDTLVNYGEVRSFRASNYANFDKITFNTTNLGSYLYGYEDNFLVRKDVDRDVIRRYPRAKRGIGGVIGRLQRGGDQFMVGDRSFYSSTGQYGEFDFIVNMNPNVDLIGRLDQNENFSFSATTFSFAGAKYYSARVNDYTQAVFTGFNFMHYRQSVGSNELTEVTYTKMRFYEYNEGGNRYRQYEAYTQKQDKYVTSGSWYNRVYVYERKVLSAIGNVINSLGYSQRQGGTFNSTNNTPQWVNYGDRILVGAANPDFPDNVYFPSEQGYQESGVFAIPYNANPPANNRLSNATYIDVRDVPLVSEVENPTSNEIYVYHEAFEMRNPYVILSNGEKITSYIKFAENDVLGPRFVGTRPNGMYVLSTSSGADFGQKLPINTEVAKLLKLDGSKPHSPEIYDNLNHREMVDKSLDFRFVNHTSLWQVNLNDESELLQVDQDLRIKDKNGNFELVPSDIDYENKEITFELDMDLLKVGQSSLDFDIIAANIPYQAFIAADYDSGVHPPINTFIDDLENERESNPNRIVSVNYPPSLMSNFVATYPHLFELKSNGKYEFRQGISENELTINLGQFMVYSEASLDTDTLFNVPQYKTLYDVKIILKRSSVNIVPTAYLIDGVTVSPHPALAETVWLHGANQNISETLKVNHRDYSHSSGNNPTMPVGTDIKDYVELYYYYTPQGGSDEVWQLVDPNHYSLTTVSVQPNTGTFSFEITFSENMRAGTYNVKYKYYENDAYKNIRIIKAQNTNDYLEALKPQNLSEIIPANVGGQNFQSEVPFLYEILSSDLTVTPYYHAGVPIYLDNKEYTMPLFDYFYVSPFATLTNVTYNKNYDVADGYVSYVLTYSIQSEAASQPARVYTHTITEKQVSVHKRYKDLVEQHIALTADREVESTIFEFTFDIDSSYNAIFYNLDQSQDVYLEITTTAEGYDESRYSIVNNRLRIMMLNVDLPGDYVFDIALKRKVGNETYTVNIGSETITKLPGTSSYLTNIAFGDEGAIGTYPDIYILNAPTTDPNDPSVPIDPTDPIIYPDATPVDNYQFSDVNTAYNNLTAVHPGGINYGGADEVGEQHILIEGEVDMVNLNEFIPRMVEFLPIGATIQRLYYVESAGGYDIYYTPAVDASSNISDIAQLAADFTLYPTDLSEPTDESTTDVIITYVVTAENGNKTYYYLSVGDAVFNVTFIFDIYYYDPVAEEEKLVVNVAKFYNIPIRVQIAVMDTDYTQISTNLPTVDLFPDFTTINGIHHHMSLFYLALEHSNLVNYRFRFSRNIAGLYQFILDLPHEYTYKMFYGPQDVLLELQDIEDIHPNHEGVEGKYFYINSGIRNRTRRIKAVIYDTTPDLGWGLTDNGATYHD